MPLILNPSLCNVVAASFGVALDLTGGACRGNAANSIASWRPPWQVSGALIQHAQFIHFGSFRRGEEEPSCAARQEHHPEPAAHGRRRWFQRHSREDGEQRREEKASRHSRGAEAAHQPKEQEQGWKVCFAVAAAVRPHTAWRWNALPTQLLGRLLIDLPALFLLFWLMRRLSASRMTARFLLAPLFAILAGMALEPASPPVRGWLGMVFLAGGAGWLLFAPPERTEVDELSLLNERTADLPRRPPTGN